VQITQRKTKGQLYVDTHQAARIAQYIPQLEAKRQRLVLQLEELDALIADEVAAERHLRETTYATDDAPTSDQGQPGAGNGECGTLAPAPL
jgi:hypothetical protein